MRKHLIWSFSLILLFYSCSLTHLKHPPIIRMKGSDTMFLLTQMLAEEYMRANPGISIYTEGGGSATGIQALIKGEVNISNVSRPVRPEEASIIADKYASVGVSFRIAKDALCLYLNKDNPVKDLTMEQIKKIYTGEFSKWSQVGGANAPIELLSRHPNSGSFMYLKEHIMDGEEFGEQNLGYLPTTRSVIEQVKLKPFAIGYGGITTEAGLTLCRVNGIVPNEYNVINDTYPITRYLYLYTINTPNGQIKKYIDWILSEKGQQIVKKAGFFPIWVIFPGR